ncbi:DNA polymerase lambda (POLL) [Raphanus sativus]|nr:DNA polymerase lambda (POLL) [Raphanus sativus]
MLPLLLRLFFSSPKTCLRLLSPGSWFSHKGLLDKGTGSGVDTYFGLCTYPGQELRRRIDFKVYPRDIYAFGHIAWTGNDVLNRRSQEIDSMTLDCSQLLTVQVVTGVVRASASMKLSTEKQVFDFLGFPWLEPHERNL